MWSMEGSLSAISPSWERVRCFSAARSLKILPKTTASSPSLWERVAQAVVLPDPGGPLMVILIRSQPS